MNRMEDKTEDVIINEDSEETNGEGEE